MEFETLQTERLFLKKITPEIFTQIFNNLPKKEIKKILGLTTDEEFNTEKNKHLGGYKTYDRTIVAFIIILKQNNETIGRCGFHNWYSLHRRAELGYTLHKEEYKRKGYMTEALTEVLKYGFESMNLNRIEATVSPTNIPSINLLRNNGFTKEGYLRQHFIRNDQIGDSLLFSLLKEEYR